LFRTGQAETDRVEAFSDGVLAIVITLLVLEITPTQRAGRRCGAVARTAAPAAGKDPPRNKRIGMT
jgi:uncharacterized membrane protein